MLNDHTQSVHWSRQLALVFVFILLASCATNKSADQPKKTKANLGQSYFLGEKWPAYTDEKRKAANQAGQYVLVHVYATWDVMVVVDYSALRRSEELYVFLNAHPHQIQPMAMDITDIDSEIQASMEYLGVISAETTVLIGPDGKVVWEGDRPINVSDLLVALEAHIPNR